MQFNDVYLIVPNPALSGIIWFVVLSCLLYFARRPVHQYMVSFGRVLHNAFKLAALSVRRGEARLQARNREVLLAAGREASERIIEREFDRIDAAVNRDFGQFPAFQRGLSESLKQIDEDYQRSTEVPPDPPGWTKAVEAVAKIDAKGDPMVGQILKDIHASLVRFQERAVSEHRRSSMERHKVLKSMMPYWRDLQKVLNRVDSHVTGLMTRVTTVGNHMQDYQEILKGSDRAVRLLSSSAINQFFISAFVLAIAVGGAIINFTLIARPMAEMVGGQALIGSYRTSEIAALVIILVEISMGLFLMESLRITRLFPVIGALNDKLRRRMIWITFSILFILASVESGLAFMREILMQDELATSALLRGEQAAVGGATEFAWITTVAQMGMGFILPFALVFVAIPLETFVHSLRTVLGVLSAGALRTLATLLRVLGNVCRYGSRLLINVYDLIIFVPLWLESMLEKYARSRGNHSGKGSLSDIGEASI